MAFAVLRVSTSWVCRKDEDCKGRVATKLKRLDGTSNGSLQALYTVSTDPIICTCLQTMHAKDFGALPQLDFDMARWILTWLAGAMHWCEVSQ